MAQRWRDDYRDRDDEWADERRARGEESGYGRGNERRETGPYRHGYGRDEERWMRGGARGPDDYGRGSYYGGEFGRHRSRDDDRRWRDALGADFSRSDYGRDWTSAQARGFDQRPVRGESWYPDGNWPRDRFDRRDSRDYAHPRDHDRNERGFWDRASDEISSWFGDEEAERRRRMDHMRERHDERERVQGRRGPKNYTRSSERIREDVCDRLSSDWRLDASEVEVEVHGTEVTLSGTVTSRDQRRRAEDLAEQVLGVTHVQNNIRVAQTQHGSFAGTPQSRESVTAGGVAGAGGGSAGSGASGSAAGGGSSSASASGAGFGPTGYGGGTNGLNRT